MNVDICETQEVNWQDYIMLERENYLAQQALDGFEVLYPADNELQLDIDSQEQLDNFLHLWECFKRHIEQEYKVALTHQTFTSKSGNWHIHIRLPFKVDNWQRMAWQAALGSDPMRELLGCLRTLYNDPKPSLLLRKPDDTEGLL